MVEVVIKAHKVVRKRKSRSYHKDWVTLTLLFQIIILTTAAIILGFIILFA